MKSFYKIENGKALVGSGIKVPEGFIEYTDEPQELTDALAAEQAEHQATVRIAELIQLLADSDHKMLPDYQERAGMSEADVNEVKAMRKAWYDEMKALENSQ